MKTIAVTNMLPFYITNTKDTPSTLRARLLKTLTSKSQQTKESSSKSLLEVPDTDPSIVPRPLFLTGPTPSCALVGVPIDCVRLSADARVSIQRSLRGRGIYPVFFDGKKVRDWTERLRNLFECRQWNDVFLKNESSYCDYRGLNRKAFDEVKKVYDDSENDVLWVCDAEYWLVPGLARDELNCVIGVTIVVPFPDIDIFRCAPAPVEILKSLLASNYIEFQDETYLKNFVKCCEVYLKSAGYFSETNKMFFKEREIQLGVNRLGINTDKVKKITDSTACKERITHYKRKFADRKIIVSVIKRGDTVTATSVLMAYESLLSKCGSVVLLLVEIGEGLPDYEAMNENKRIIDFIEINHPASHVEIFYPVEDAVYYALLSVGDIGLMIDERDAIGKSSWEFLACGENKQVVTSKFATFSKDMIRVNPKDYMEISSVIERLLTSTAEEQVHNTNSTPEEWSGAFIEKLQSLKIKKSKTSKKLIGLVERYKESSNRLICLDYDGTLTKLVKDPLKAKPDQELLALLDKLASDPKNDVYIITGRSKDIIDSWITHPKIKISAEHGHFIKDKTWLETICTVTWKKSAREIIQFFVERTPNSFLEEKETALCFHYRACDEKIAKVQSKALKSALCKVFDERVIEGSCIIEIKGKDSHKGQVLRMIVDEKKDKHDFILIAGDDTTDEDMFRENFGDKMNSVIVGDRQSMAKYRVKDVQEMRELLKKMADNE